MPQIDQLGGAQPENNKYDKKCVHDQRNSHRPKLGLTKKTSLYRPFNTYGLVLSKAALVNLVSNAIENNESFHQTGFH